MGYGQCIVFASYQGFVALDQHRIGVLVGLEYGLNRFQNPDCVLDGHQHIGHGVAFVGRQGISNHFVLGIGHVAVGFVGAIWLGKGIECV